MATTTRISQEFFGKTSDGRQVQRFTFRNGNNVTVSVLNYGCIVLEILTPDKDGNVLDINLGYDNIKGYESNPNNFGGLIGRVANRIGKGKFTLDGTTYQVSQNDSAGGHCLHGGFQGYIKKLWDASIDGEKLVLKYVDKDGNEGFPGDVTCVLTYELTNDNTLVLDFTATSTKPTPVDVGSHVMFNLAGHAAGDIGDHVITINSDKFIRAGDDFLPTGELPGVEGTVMDCRKPTRVKEVLDKLEGGIGFHQGYIVGDVGIKKFMTRVEHPVNKRYMELYSTSPTVFVYGSYFVDILSKDQTYKDGAKYQKYSAFELMPMGYPNSVNNSQFPNIILRPGDTYHVTSWYKFGVAS